MVLNKICIFMLLTIPAVVYSTGCSFAPNSNPLVLNAVTEKLKLPRAGFINLQDNELIKLSCTDKHFISNTNPKLSLMSARCNAMHNTLYLSSNQPNVPFDQIKCDKHIRGDVFKTNTSCGNTGYVSYIGYYFKKNFRSLIKVCYDFVKGNALYSQHKLDGTDILVKVAGGTRKPYRPNFSKEGLPPTIEADKIYTIAMQKKVFTKLLNDSNFIKPNNYLARGHLTPDADFTYDVYQRFTYFYINVCPQWQSINNGNWKSLEISIKKTAAKYSTSLTIVTGTHEILQLKDGMGKMTKIYLSGKKVPVPKYIWKIVYNKNSGRGIALIILNNPSKNVVNYKLCNDVCEKYDWGTSKWKILSKGYIQCCDLTTFASIVDTAPAFVDNGVLRGFK